MTSRRSAVGDAWLVGALVTTALAGQDTAAAAEFDRLADEVRSDDDPEQQAAAARRALRAFLRLPPEAEARQLRLARAAELAFLGGDLERCRRWVAEALAAGVPVADAGRLRALDWRVTLLRDGGDAALEACYAARDQVPDEVSRGFLVAAQVLERGALFEAAQRRLRIGAGEDAGWWALRTLAETLAAGPLDTVQQRFGAALALGNLALAARQHGDLEAAESAYRRAVELYDADAILWNDFGMLLRAQRRDDEAVAALRRSVEVEAAPGEGPGLTNLGLLYRLRGGQELPAGFRSAVVSIARAGGEAVEGADGTSPEQDLAAAYGVLLARRPEQTLVRRMLVDLLVPRPR